MSRGRYAAAWTRRSTRGFARLLRSCARARVRTPAGAPAPRSCPPARRGARTRTKRPRLRCRRRSPAAYAGPRGPRVVERATGAWPTFLAEGSAREPRPMSAPARAGADSSLERSSPARPTPPTPAPACLPRCCRAWGTSAGTRGTSGSHARPASAGASARRRGSDRDRASGAMAGRGRCGGTSGAAGGRTRAACLSGWWGARRGRAAQGGPGAQPRAPGGPARACHSLR